MADLVILPRTSGRRTADHPTRRDELFAVLRVVGVVLATAALLWLLYAVRTVLLLLVFAVLFAYLVAPLVVRIERRGAVSRGVAIGITYLLVVGIASVFLGWVGPHVAAAIKETPPSSAHAMQMRIAGMTDHWLSRFGLSAAWMARVFSATTAAVQAAGRAIGSALVMVAASLPWVVLTPIVAFFLLKDAPAFNDAAMAQLPERWRPHAPVLIQRIDQALAAYIRAQLVACLIVGVACGIGFTLLRVPFGAVLGVAAGVAEFLPLVGPLVIALVAAVIAALHSPLSALWVLIFLAVLRGLEDYVIYPRLVGSRIHLHPLAVILAVLAGGEIGGMIGVLLSVPALAVLSAVYRYSREQPSA